MNEITRKVALITGGSRGIGKETAMLLASKGITVVITGRDQTAGIEAVQRIKKFAKAAGTDEHVSFIQNNVDDEADVRRMIEAIVDRYGRLDLAVNNAGVSTENKVLSESDTQAFKYMIETNVLGVYYCMKYEIQQMQRQQSGSIVNLASIAGLNGIPWVSTYAATKHAVVGLTKSSALDHATQNIRINAVAPGAIRTDLIASQITLGQYDEASIQALHPMMRMGLPREIAQGICWLLSDEASFVTGHVMSIDGGFQSK